MNREDLIYFASLIDDDDDLLLAGKTTQNEVADNIINNNNVTYERGAGEADIDLISTIETIKTLFEIVKITYDLYTGYLDENKDNSHTTIEDIVSKIINIHNIDDEKKIIVLKAIINKDRGVG